MENCMTQRDVRRPPENVAERPKEVITTMDELLATIQSLEKTVEILKSRLVPVLGAGVDFSTPSERPRVEPVRKICAPIAESLLSRTAEIRMITRDLHAVIDSLEI